MQHADMINAALEHLFVEWFGNTPGHRISFLAKRRLGFHLRIFFRYSHGTSTHFKSRAHQTYRLSRWQARALSNETAEIRWIVCYGIVDPDGRALRLPGSAGNTPADLPESKYRTLGMTCRHFGVLSIDSIDPASLVRIKPETLKACSDLLGAMMLAHDFSKPD